VAQVIIRDDVSSVCRQSNVIDDFWAWDGEIILREVRRIKIFSTKKNNGTGL